MDSFGRYAFLRQQMLFVIAFLVLWLFTFRIQLLPNYISSVPPKSMWVLNFFKKSVFNLLLLEQKELTVDCIEGGMVKKCGLVKNILN